MVKARLTKSRTDKVIDGVCGGIAEYFNIDPVIVRLVFVIFLFMNGLGILLYIILAIIMPKDDRADQLPGEAIQENVQEMGERLKEAGEKFGSTLSEKSEQGVARHARWLGVLLILLGLYFLLNNLNMLRWFHNIFWWFDTDVFWPLVLILIGAWLLISRLRG
ncbi:MAG: PspC domain-containing protein [Candidatus Methanoperedens sp.]|nr:PspC domain-containing protein [Candidatus Methanoperedens sp.]